MGRQRPSGVTCVLAGISLVLGLTSTSIRAADNDHPWAAELSDPGPHDKKAPEIDIWVPAGEYVTVAFYNTPGVKVWDHKFIRSEVYRIRHESRTVFEGMPEQRQAGIPCYLLPTKGYKASEGDKPACAVRLICDQPGVHTVRCVTSSGDARWVTLRVTEPVPPSDCGFGFCKDTGVCDDPEQQRKYMQHMRDHGCNTFMLYSQIWDSKELGRQLNAAAKAGLMDKQFPVLLLSGTPWRIIMPEAAALGRINSDWPEMIPCVRHEPSRDREQQVREVAKNVRQAGLRTSATMSAASAFLFGDALDIWVLHMDGLSDALRDKCTRDGAEWWVYNLPCGEPTRRYIAIIRAYGLGKCARA